MVRSSVSVPLVLVAIALIVGGAITVRRFGAEDVFRDAVGRPLGTYAGDGIKCPLCAGVLNYRGEHNYTCQDCGRSMQGRRDPNSSAIEFTPAE